MAEVIKKPRRVWIQQGGERILGKGKEPLGGAIVLLLIYLFLEYVRPVYPLGMPLIISIVLFIWWTTLKDKIWVPQVVCFYLLIAVIAVMGPFAVNNYAVWVGFQNFIAWLVCISIPMMHFANSLRKFRLLVNALIGLHCYLAIHALMHNGFGPGGFVGDENDVALAINTIIPLAFCSSLGAQTTREKSLYLTAVVIMMAGVVATNSRGGFLGLVAVLAYCFIFSPRKKMGLMVGALLVVGGLLVIPSDYWQEMATISRDAESDVGTGAHRKKLWGVAWEMFLANPIFGVGIDNFRFNAGDYMSQELIEKEGRSYAGTVAHSVYFTILAETGAAGSLVVAAIVYFSVKSIRNILRQVKKISAATDLEVETRASLLEIKGFAYGLRGGIIGYGVSGVFLTAFMYPHFWYVVALIVALAKLIERMVMESAESQSVALEETPRARRTFRRERRVTG
jgi:O-antigen ligase